MTFEQFFKLATGHPPFRWQARLYQRLLKGNVPRRCNIPTGLGKTSIIQIWLLALAEQFRAGHAAITLPRRLIYIVDRRVVVDQATEEAEELLAKLKPAASAGPSHPLGSLACRLAEAGSLKDSDPFTVSTLRGQHADKGLWMSDPARPAIIIGTVDMIGSRLLFSGYGGLGRYSRSFHAALLAQDALVVLDEAHLCPSFVETLDALSPQLNRRRLIKPFHVMLFSATQLPPVEVSAGEASGKGDDFTLKPEQDLEDAEVARRLQAPKALVFLKPAKGAEPEKPEAVAGRMASAAVALAGRHSAVVVFASTVDRVNRVSESLKSPPLSVPAGQVLKLTGEMRGQERDKLVEHQVFSLFRQRHSARGKLSQPIFLVATAAGEVGINFDADHAVCDLVTLERMVQRFGRVNRFGESAANIQVVLAAAPDRQERPETPEATTLRVLESLPKVGRRFDASPAALSQIVSGHPEAQNAFAPRPPCPPLDEARLDDWSLTTLSGREFARPQVTYWLRGLTPDSTPHTWLAWRADLDFAVDADDAARMAETIPLRPAELAQVNTFRAGELIGKLRQRSPGAFAALLDPAGNWSGIKLGDLPEKKELRDRLLMSATLVLPASIGGLKGGVLDESDHAVRDVVEPGLFKRILVRRTTEGWVARELARTGAAEPLGTYDSIPEACRMIPRALGPKTKFLGISGPEEEPLEDLTPEPEPGQPATVCCVAYFASADAPGDLGGPGDFASLQPADVPLHEHNAAVAAIARQLTAKLELPADLADAVVQACARHDLGKKQPHWQKAIGNPSGPPLAKSARARFDRTLTSGYRHEFGSLLEAALDPLIAAHPRRDLILHLIASHHGYGRPGFGQEAFEILPLHGDCRAAVREAELRFARLQREFGWWQLAYLESLVKCADALASAQSQLAAP